MKTLLLLAALLPLGCADDDLKPQEPVVPATDTSHYPEDPQLAPPEPPAEAPDPSDFDADTGALTDDPFGAPKGVPKMNDKSDDTLKDVPETPADQLNIPADEGMDAAAKANQKRYDKTKTATPTVPDATPPGATKPPTRGAGGKTGKKPEGTVTRFVVPKMLNVRAKPDTKAKVVRHVAAGTRLECAPVGLYCKLKDGEFVRASQLSAKPVKKPKK